MLHVRNNMKVIGIVSSPRKGGNSQALVEHVLSGAKEAGADTELVRLCDLEINPCTACFVCRNEGECVIQDDMTQIYEKLADADAVIFGAPIYFYRLNAQAYPFLDRLFALFKPDFSCRLPEGKKFVVALTCNTCGEEILNPMNEYLKNVFKMMGFIDAGYIWQNYLLMPGDLSKYPKKIEGARKIGISLVK